MSNLEEQVVKLSAVLALVLVLSNTAVAAPVVYGFDDQDDYTPISSQYAGLSFSQAAVIKAGATLNESAFPPHSLDGVLFDDGGPITIDFAMPVFSVGAYFTYMNGLSFTAYDIGGNLLDSITGIYFSNLADGSGNMGSNPNEFLQISSAGGQIARVVFSSDPGGASFVLDDLTVDAGNAIPEPSTTALMAGAACAALARRRRRRSTRS